MEKEGKEQGEAELFLQWGNRKRLRCVRVRGTVASSSSAAAAAAAATRLRWKISSRFVTISAKDSAFLPPPTRITRSSDTAALRSEKQRSVFQSPEKEIPAETAGANLAGDDNNRAGGGVVWPKLYITLSSKEKEEDFMAMKGCKLPQRPKKRAKLIQRTLLLVSPGAWLTDMSFERYEVREKKSSKKRARGLKAMGSVESDSE